MNLKTNQMATIKGKNCAVVCLNAVKLGLSRRGSGFAPRAREENKTQKLLGTASGVGANAL